MKTCPVCRARTFEDAEVCYGCLHRFEGGGRVAAAPEDAAWEPADVAQRAASVPPSAQTQHRLQANTQMRSQVQARARTQPHEPAGPRCRRTMLPPREIPPLQAAFPPREAALALRASRLPAYRRHRGRMRREPPVEPAVLLSRVMWSVPKARRSTRGPPLVFPRRRSTMPAGSCASSCRAALRAHPAQRAEAPGRRRRPELSRQAGRREPVPCRWWSASALCAKGKGPPPVRRFRVMRRRRVAACPAGTCR